MINYYYADPIEKVQYFVTLESLEDVSEIKVKNAIAKEAVKGLINRIGTVSNEDKKTLTKRLKTSIYTGSLINGYTNIEITGEFTKTVATMENIEIIDNNGIKIIEAEKFNSKVLENVYISKDELNRYNVYYKRIFLLNCKTKSDIENKLNECIDKIESHVNNMLVKFKFKAPETKEQLNTYKEELTSDIEYLENRIERMINKNLEQSRIDIKVNELNALKDELILVESMLSDNETIEEIQEIKEVENNDIIKSAMITKLFAYEDIAEYKDYKMISGYENNINYEGQEVKQAMHVIIYNTSSSEIIYQTGSNIRLDSSTLLQYADTLLKVIEKYISDNWNLNKLMDNFFREFKFIQFNIIKKQYEDEEMELKKKTEQTAINNENTELENKLIDICINKELKLAKNYGQLYVIEFKDKRCNKTLSSKFILDELVYNDKWKNEYDIIYSNDNTSNLKECNIALKNAIKIIS